MLQLLLKIQLLMVEKSIIYTYIEMKKLDYNKEKLDIYNI